MAKGGDGPGVFINCPFDSEYGDFFDALVFTVIRCGFVVRCTKEIRDSASIRIKKIVELIRESALGIHDLSRIDPDEGSGLPRFNMPFELGLFIGACEFGDDDTQKHCLILDKEQYRYQAFLSDIGGQDISAHNGELDELIREVRDFLRTHTKGRHISGGATIGEEFGRFRRELPRICEELDLEPDRLTFADYSHVVATYLAGDA